MPSKWISILIGVLAYVLISLIINVVGSGAGALAGALGCLAILGSAMIAVWHYTSTHQLTIPGGAGAGMGALVGLIGAVISGAIGYALISMGILPDPMTVAAEQMRERGMSREDIEQAQEMMGAFSSPVIGIAIGAVLGSVGGAIGGVLGASFFKKGGAGAAGEGF